MTLDHRPVEPADPPLLCTFPHSAEELFFLFPTATDPLTVAPLATAIARRYRPPRRGHRGDAREHGRGVRQLRALAAASARYPRQRYRHPRNARPRRGALAD